MKILVTGGAGFIGQHVVGRLLASGHAVLVLDDFSTGKGERLDRHQVEIMRGSFLEPELCSRAMNGVEGLVHLAAMISVPESVARPELCHRINVEATEALFLAAARAGVRNAVFASSCAVYGRGGESPLSEDDPVDPLSPYAISKLAGESLLRQCLPGRGVALRFFNVYGPGQRADGGYAAAIPKFIAAAIAGETPVIYGDGSQTRDFIYAGDVARAVCLALTAPPAARDQVYNVGTGIAVGLNDLLSQIRGLPGSRLPPAIHQPERQGDIRHSRCNPAKAGSGIGFSPEVDMAQGMRRLWQSATGP
jgi:nucleoside-diphosphate-sugar epimerase